MGIKTGPSENRGIHLNSDQNVQETEKFQTRVSVRLEEFASVEAKIERT